ncbi:DUF3617 domain-containing protein [Sphingomonas sp. ASY06-1R]|jgi:hypothetical protein|uniref:DUF3617 domain-containing protein n=1 Tax=Sphingomonas sp. ASY06-1R TaxID=3445771 RepID=UPI003FA271FB
MRGIKTLALLAAAIGTAAAAAPAAQKWHWALTYDFRIERVNGAPVAEPLAEHSTEAFCDVAMTQAVLNRVLMPGTGDNCKMDRFTYADGKIAFAGGCERDKKGLIFSATGEGRYDDSTLRIDVKAHADAGGRPMDATGVITGTREGRCG